MPPTENWSTAIRIQIESRLGRRAIGESEGALDEASRLAPMLIWAIGNEATIPPTGCLAIMRASAMLNRAIEMLGGVEKLAGTAVVSIAANAANLSEHLLRYMHAAGRA